MRKALILVAALLLVGCTGRYVSRGEFQEMLDVQAEKHTETRQLVNGLSQQVATIEANQRATTAELGKLNVELGSLNAQMRTLLSVLVETPVPREPDNPFRRGPEEPE